MLKNQELRDTPQTWQILTNTILIFHQSFAVPAKITNEKRACIWMALSNVIEKESFQELRTFVVKATLVNNTMDSKVFYYPW